MTIQEEVAYSKEISKKVHYREATNEERLWFRTHAEYSEYFEYPAITKDVISLLPNKKYKITVEFVSSCCSAEITPTLFVAAGSGYILPDEKVEDMFGHVYPARKCKAVSTLTCKEHPSCSFEFSSKLGKMAIVYEYDDTDFRGARFLRASNVTPKLAMLKTEISENKVQYSCVEPGNTDLGGYVFSVEWTLIEKLKKSKRQSEKTEQTENTQGPIL